MCDVLRSLFYILEAVKQVKGIRVAFYKTCCDGSVEDAG